MIPDFLFHLNQEEKPAANHINLELFINIIFTKEDSVVPNHSSTFGAKIRGKTLQKFSETDFYKGGFLNLNKLYDMGKLYNCVIDSEHVKSTILEKYLILNLLDDKLCKENELRPFWKGQGEPPMDFYYKICPFFIYAQNYQFKNGTQNLF